MLDDHLSTCAKKGHKDEIARLDEILYATISTPSALCQLLSMVRIRRPRADKVSIQQAMKTGTGKVWRYANAGYFEQDHRTFRDGEWKILTTDINPKAPKGPHNERATALSSFGELMRDFLATSNPTGSRATKKWLEEDGIQRAASSRLFAALRHRYQRTLERIKLGSDDIVSDLRVL